MPTGRLGNSGSLLGRIVLGSDSGDNAATSRLLRARANILNRTAQTVTARANLSARTVRQVQARANIPVWSKTIYDSFDRANNASLGNAETGQTWAMNTALAYAIDTNKVKATSGSFGGGATLNSLLSGTAGTPILLSVDVFNVGLGNGTGLIFRAGNATDNNQFFAYLIKDTGVYRMRLVLENGGSFSGGTLYDQPVAGITVNDSETHTIKVILQGTSISLWLDDALQTRVVNSNFQTNAYHGVFLSVGGSADRVDNFGLFTNVGNAFVQARAFIVNGTIQTKTVDARANIQGTTTYTVSTKARVVGFTLRQVSARARLQPAHFGQIQARAKIQATTSRTVNARARLTRPNGTVQARARITAVASHTLSARGHILLGAQQQVTARAHLLGATITLTAEVDFNVGSLVTLNVPVRFDVGRGTRSYGWFSARANIRSAVTLTVPVEFDTVFPLPGPPVLRPTQRSQVRSRRGVMARAHIIGGRLS